MGPKQGRSPRRALVGGPGHEQRLGPRNDEIGVVEGRRSQLGLQPDVVAEPSAGPARDRPLATTTTQDEDSHASTPSKDSLACASPTSIGYWPVKHALQ